jgi:hypothetical protein
LQLFARRLESTSPYIVQRAPGALGPRDEPGGAVDADRRLVVRDRVVPSSEQARLAMIVHNMSLAV